MSLNNLIQTPLPHNNKALVEIMVGINEIETSFGRVYPVNNFISRFSFDNLKNWYFQFLYRTHHACTDGLGALQFWMELLNENVDYDFKKDLVFQIPKIDYITMLLFKTLQKLQLLNMLFHLPQYKVINLLKNRSSLSPKKISGKKVMH